MALVGYIKKITVFLINKIDKQPVSPVSKLDLPIPKAILEDVKL